MGDHAMALAQYLFGNTSMDAMDVQAIENLVEKYPYFAPARFLLLEKLKNTDPDAYRSALDKAILYYHNPLEFQYLVDSGRFYTELPVLETAAPAEVEPAVVAIIAELQEGDSADEAIAQEILEKTEPADVKSIEEKTPDELAVTPLSTDEVEADDVELTPDESTSTEQESPAAQHDVFARITQDAEKQPASDLSFEPYHAVDYFASQGIKLSQEDVGKDKFGKQLRSFTDWLKTMKRLPATQLAAQPESTSEHVVKDMAEDSVHQSEVYTETMAEVWVKQGNYAKAVEIYNKLKLTHPAKKAYFAGKIENLKRK
jgi:hypothetical protein